MADTKIAAVFRAREYSPNHIGNDAAILNATCEQLRKRGCSVETFSEERLMQEGLAYPHKFDAWLSMARSPRCVELLKHMGNEGELVINSGDAIENCRRGNMCRILSAHNIPIADFLLVATDESVVKQLMKDNYSKCWIKQADNHSMHKEDVTFVRHREEAQEVLQEYFLRGIKNAVISRHLQGDLIRFYGVRGTNFFQWFLPMDDRHHSPDSSDEPTPTSLVDEGLLKDLCSAAAEALELRIYGGDCILLPTGELKLIDVNDWPSFAPCRRAASSVIARFLLKEIRQN